MRITESKLRSIIRNIIKESINDDILERACSGVEKCLADYPELTDFDSSCFEMLEPDTFRFLIRYFGLASYNDRVYRERLESFCQEPDLERVNKVKAGLGLI